MSKVIFLDIDGVLNRHDERYGTREKSPMGFVGLGQKHLIQLRRVVEVTGAEIVMSSDWKMCYKSDDCNPKYANADGLYVIRRLAENGMKLVAVTNEQSLDGEYSTGRGYGIRKYLRQHPEVTEYVILDDYVWRDFTDELLEHLVYLKYPLTKRTADKAIKILKGNEK